MTDTAAMAACKPFLEHLVKGRYVPLAGPHAAVESGERTLLLVAVHSSGWPGEVASRVADVLQAEVAVVCGAAPVCSANDSAVHALLPGRSPADGFVALAVPSAALRSELGHGAALLRGELASAASRPCTTVPRLLYYDVVGSAVVRATSADELQESGSGSGGGDVTAALAAAAAAQVTYLGAGVRLLRDAGVPLVPVADEELAAVAAAAKAAAKAGGAEVAELPAPTLKGVASVLGVAPAPAERVRSLPALTGPPLPDQLRAWGRVRLSDPGMLCRVSDHDHRVACLSTLFQRDSHERAGGMLLAEYCSTIFRPPTIFGYDSVPRQCRVADVALNLRNEICQQIVSLAYGLDRIVQRLDDEARGFQLRETVDLHGTVTVSAYRAQSGVPPRFVAQSTSRMYPIAMRRKAHLDCMKKIVTVLRIPPCTKRFPSKALTISEPAETAKLRDLERRVSGLYRFGHDEFAANCGDDVPPPLENTAPTPVVLAPVVPTPAPAATPSVAPEDKNAGGPPPTATATATATPQKRGALKTLMLSLLSNPSSICYADAQDARADLADLIEQADAHGKPFDGDVLSDYCTHVLRPPALCGFPPSFTKLRPIRFSDSHAQGKCRSELVYSVHQIVGALEAFKEWEARDARGRRLRIREELRAVKKGVNLCVRVFVDGERVASHFSSASSATGRRSVFKRVLRSAADVLKIQLPPPGKPGTRGAQLNRIWALDAFFRDVYRFGPPPQDEPPSSRKRQRSYSADRDFSPPPAKHSCTATAGDDRGGSPPPPGGAKRRYEDARGGEEEPPRRPAPPRQAPPPPHDAAARLVGPSAAAPQSQPPPPRNPPPPPALSRAPPPLPSTPPPPQGAPMARPGSMVCACANGYRRRGATMVQSKTQLATHLSPPPTLPHFLPHRQHRLQRARAPAGSLASKRVWWR